jgi:hypothetical protein
MSDLRPISEYQEERSRELRAKRKTRGGTGLACPVCGSEMIERHPGSVLCSKPPQKAVDCSGCDYNTIIWA